MKSNEIRELSVQELQERIDVESTRLNQMVLNHKVSPLDQPSSITKQRKLVARLKTILSEKSIESINN
ncbi:50S ribosomal protein L29 [Porphyromonadaceae bacterium W3.11]|nr:50S ribosomal protein L29 [Porphyromonadaceae bacterium W3.11]